MGHFATELGSAGPLGPAAAFARSFSPDSLHEPAAVEALLTYAKSASVRLALCTQGLRPVDTSKAQIVLNMRRILRAELADGVATAMHDASRVSGMSGRGHSARIQGALGAMAKDCADLIDNFSVDNEESLYGLSRACLGALQVLQACGSAGDVARIEMTKILWQAQSAAQTGLREQRRAATAPR